MEYIEKQYEYKYEYEYEYAIEPDISIWVDNFKDFTDFNIRAYLKSLDRSNLTIFTNALINDFYDYFYIKDNIKFITSREYNKLNGFYGQIEFPNLTHISKINKTKIRNMTIFCFDSLVNK